MGHHSVLEHVNMTFGLEGMSRACSHQLVRHRIASYSQQSQRYVKFNKHNTLDYVLPKSIKEESVMEDSFHDFMKHVSGFYNFLITHSIPAEDARFVLPNACCTNIIMTVNARELIEMCKVRLCTTAQWEIREMFDMIKATIKSNRHLSFLYTYLNPKCDWIKFCPEGDRCCGRYNIKDKKDEKGTSG
jgi:thymidylate synthase (FAD)